MPAPAPVTRPRSIRACQYLLVAAAAVSVVDVLTTPVALTHLAMIEQKLFDMGAPDEIPVVSTADSLRVAVKVQVVLSVICLLASAYLVWRLGRGDHRARTVAWVAMPVVALGEVMLIASDPGQSLAGAVDGTHSAFFNRALELFHQLLPGWYLTVYFSAEFACLATAVAVGWLLLSHGARDFFDSRRRSTAADEAKLWDISRVNAVRPDAPRQR